MAADAARWQQYFRDAPPQPGDEQVGDWSHSQLVRINNRFRARLLRALEGQGEPPGRSLFFRTAPRPHRPIKRPAVPEEPTPGVDQAWSSRSPAPYHISQVIMPTANSSASKEVVTAALLVIGSKILSGRTKDQNMAISRNI